MKKSNIQASPGESLAALLVAIEAYFDCRLSDEEEKQLRRTIARTRMVHPAIDEAKAVMGLGRRSVVKRRSLRLPASVNIAASVALLVAGAWGISKYFSQPVAEEMMVAYVNGKAVTDEDEVMRLFAANLDIMRQGVDDVNERMDEMLDIIEPAIEGYNSVKPLDI